MNISYQSNPNEGKTGKKVAERKINIIILGVKEKTTAGRTEKEIKVERFKL